MSVATMGGWGGGGRGGNFPHSISAGTFLMTGKKRRGNGVHLSITQKGTENRKINEYRGFYLFGVKIMEQHVLLLSFNKAKYKGAAIAVIIILIEF